MVSRPGRVCRAHYMEQDHLGRKEVAQREGVAPGPLGDPRQVGRPQDPLNRREGAVPLPGPERKNRDGNGPEDRLGDTSHQQMGEAGAPLGRHQDEIGSAHFGRPGDPRDRLAHHHLDLDRQEAPELSRHDRREPFPGIARAGAQEQGRERSGGPPR